MTDVRTGVWKPAVLSGRDLPGPGPIVLILVLVGLALRVAVTVAAAGPPSAAAMVRHLAGVAVALAVHRMLRRWDVWPWLAGLAVLPFLWDGRILAAEQEGGTGFLVLMLASVALVVLCWASDPPPALRAAGTLLLVVALGWLVLAGVGPAATLPRGTIDAVWVRALLAITSAAVLPTALLVVCALVAAAAAVGAGRARGSSMRIVAGLAVTPAVAVLLVEQLTGRGEPGAVTAVVWAAVAGALGSTALLRGNRSPAAGLPQHDDVDDAAIAEFDRRYGHPTLAPVTVVIAAYNEEDGLPAVLATLPDTVEDLPLDIVVVDDGSRDATVTVVEADPRARVVKCSRNRGQGAALRLGYRVAREHGARYVITTDADGQYDVDDLATVLRPVVEGRADFVTGSRLLGHQHTHDLVRRTGVHVFAWVVSALVGVRVTDTSFGLRAMRAEVTASVTLNQPQYQSSELLIGVLSHGYRVLEVPATMHVRSAGASKKGRNLVYGSRYARVVLGTWWREGCPRPVADDAPALQSPHRR